MKPTEILDLFHQHIEWDEREEAFQLVRDSLSEFKDLEGLDDGWISYHFDNLDDPNDSETLKARKAATSDDGTIREVNEQAFRLNRILASHEASSMPPLVWFEFGTLFGAMMASGRHNGSGRPSETLEIKKEVAAAMCGVLLEENPNYTNFELCDLLKAESERLSLSPEAVEWIKKRGSNWGSACSKLKKLHREIE